MDYALAKELKDARFPQDGLNHLFLYEGTFTGNNEKTRSYVPTLSELIEACGDKFCTVGRPRIDSNKWIAYAYMIPKAEGIGSTPDEAVARLWLALNKEKVSTPHSAYPHTKAPQASS